VKLPPSVLHTQLAWQLVFGHRQMKFESSGNNLVVGIQQAQQNNVQLVMQDGKRLWNEP
jgi:hypothetical protein